MRQWRRNKKFIQTLCSFYFSCSRSLARLLGFSCFCDDYYSFIYVLLQRRLWWRRQYQPSLISLFLSNESQLHLCKYLCSFVAIKIPLRIIHKCLFLKVLNEKLISIFLLSAAYSMNNKWIKYTQTYVQMLFWCCKMNGVK